MTSSLTGRLCYSLLLALLGTPLCAQTTNFADAALSDLPRPERPAATPIAPAKDFAPPPGVPVIKFANDAMPSQWLYCGPLRPARGEDPLAAIGGMAAARPKPGDKLKAASGECEFKPVDPACIVPDSYPDFCPSINVLTACSREAGAIACFYTIIEVDKPRMARLCIGAVGRAGAAVSLAGQKVEHGALVELSPGLYPLLVQASIAVQRAYPAWQWQEARIAPRLTEFTQQDLDDVFQWRLGQWQTLQDALKADPAKVTASVKMDPKTVRGKEGFVRVGRSVNGRWWLIDPEGRPFIFRGVTGLNAGGMGGRRARLPAVPAETVTAWIDTLRRWGFNGMGSWTTPEFFDKGMYYCDIVEAYYLSPWLESETYKGDIPDVYDPAWAKALDERCKAWCGPQRDSKWLVGYFTDNERGFGETIGYGVRIESKSPTRQQPPAGRAPLLQRCLSLPAEKAAYAAAWDFVLKRYDNDLAKLAKAWQIDIKSKDSIRSLREAGQALVSAGYLKDEDAWVRAFVAQYYKTVIEAIRRHDPNHLVLGMRHGGPPGPAVMEEEAKWTDIVSANNYRPTFHERMDIYYQYGKAPILNGEFGGYSDPFGNFPMPVEPPGGVGPWERERAQVFMALEQAFTHSGLVGYTQYRWNGRQAWCGVPSKLNARRMANALADTIAAQWDRPPLADPGPLTGEIFLTLQNAIVSTKPISSSVNEAEPGVATNAASLHIGLRCRKGTWDTVVCGNGLRGQVLECKTEGNAIHLSIKLRAVPGMFTTLSGTGQYTIRLQRDATNFAGSFAGTWGDQKAEGRALGHVARPIVSILY